MYKYQRGVHVSMQHIPSLSALSIAPTDGIDANLMQTLPTELQKRITRLARASKQCVVEVASSRPYMRNPNNRSRPKATLMATMYLGGVLDDNEYFDQNRSNQTRLDLISALRQLQKASVLNTGNADQGRSDFACGGGGVLLSHAVFRDIRFSNCVESCSQHPHPQSVGLDHIMHRCMKAHKVMPIHRLSCGTCGNRWSPTFTEARVLSGNCSFMHMQRSHSPRRYLGLLNSINPSTHALLVHRYSRKASTLFCKVDFM